MATYSTPKITQSVFNASNYLDTTFLTKSDADELYINELPESVERLIGNLNIVGEETVTSQVVTGNSTIGGNENITGTITAGGANNAVGNDFKHSGIHGNVWLGDSVTNTTTTVLNKLTAGGNGYKDINLNGAITNINTLETSNSTQLNIGRAGGVHTTTIKGHVNLGDENNTGVVKALGAVTLGWAKPIDIRGSTVAINIEPNSGTTTIGNGTNAINLNSTNVIVGNDNTSSVTQIRGKTIAIGNTPSDGGIQIGRGGLTANASGGQTNTFVSTVNKIFNPRLCDAYGALNTTRDFCLNSPSFCSFNSGMSLSKSGNNGTYTLPIVQNKTIYLNVPELYNFGLTTVIIEYSQTIIMCKGASGSTNGGSTSNLALNLNSNQLSATSYVTQSKCHYGIFALVCYLNVATNTPTFMFNLITGAPLNPFVQTSLTANLNGTNTACSYTPVTPTTTAGNSKITLQMGFPTNISQVYSNSTTQDFIGAYSGSFRIISSAPYASQGINSIGIYPNASTNSFGNQAYFTLS